MFAMPLQFSTHPISANLNEGDSISLSSQAYGATTTPMTKTFTGVFPFNGSYIGTSPAATPTFVAYMLPTDGQRQGVDLPRYTGNFKNIAYSMACYNISSHDKYFELYYDNTMVFRIIQTHYSNNPLQIWTNKLNTAYSAGTTLGYMDNSGIKFSIVDNGNNTITVRTYTVSGGVASSTPYFTGTYEYTPVANATDWFIRLSTYSGGVSGDPAIYNTLHEFDSINTISYTGQWYKNNVSVSQPVTNGTGVFTYSKQSAGASDVGQYKLIVSSGTAAPITSNEATITVKLSDVVRNVYSGIATGIMKGIY